MAMVDVLAHAREKALKEKNPHLMTIATLTGHAAVAMGPYTAVMDNGTAKKEQFAQKIFATGEKYGDPFEGILSAINSKLKSLILFNISITIMMKTLKHSKANHVFFYSFKYST